MVVRVTVIATKQDMATFARAHVDSPVTWVTAEGPGGTIIVYEECSE